MKYVLLIVDATFLLLACAEHDLGCRTNQNLWISNTTVSIPYLECVTNPGQNLGIRFKKVVSDSRCPSDVVCIWGGEVTVALEIIRGQNTISIFELRSLKKTDEITINGQSFEITLLKVDPYPKRSEKIEADRYNVDLSVNYTAGIKASK